MMDWPAILDTIIASDEPVVTSNAGQHLSMPDFISWSPGTIEAEWEVDPRFLNSSGKLYGGYYAVLADAVLGLAAMTVLQPEEHFLTADLRTQFFRPISEGTMKITGRVINKSRTMAKPGPRGSPGVRKTCSSFEKCQNFR